MGGKMGQCSAKDKKVLLGGGIEAMLVAMAKSETNDLKTKLYNINSEKLVRQFTSHFGPLRYIDVYGKQFVTAGQDGIVKLHSFDMFEGFIETIKTEDMVTIPKNETVQDKKTTTKPIVGSTRKIVGMNDNSQKGIAFVDKKLNTNFDKRVDEPVKRTIKLSNLPEEVTENDLYEQFDLFGKIDGRIKIVRLENNTNSASMYKDIIAYISYTDCENANKAYEQKTKNYNPCHDSGNSHDLGIPQFQRHRRFLVLCPDRLVRRCQYHG